MGLEGYDPNAEVDPGPYDHWIRARAGQATARIRSALDEYRFNEAATEIHAFIWGEVCDWYLEFSKNAIYSEGPKKAAAQQTLVEIFSAIVRLMHPIMPFLSEEIWHRLPESVRVDSQTVMLAAYPKVSDFPEDAQILEEVAFLQECIVAIRRLRSDMELAAKVPLTILVTGEKAAWLPKHAGALAHLAGISSVALLEGDRPEASATAVVKGAELVIPLEGVVDLGAERDRLDKEIAKVGKDVGDLERRLGNAGFVAKAPAHVVDGFREKLGTAKLKLVQLEQARGELA
jgi:valyl-tRNA synthetase